MMKDTSLHHRLRLRFGYIFVPDETLLTVIRDGRIHSFREPGYHHGAGWRQCYGSPISTGLRFVTLAPLPLNSADQLSVTVHISLQYIFDPRRAPLSHRAGMAATSDYGLEMMVADFASRAMRKVCGEQTEAQLADGRIRSRLERNICHELQRTLTPFGILLPGNTAVTITRITPPPEIERERIAAQARTIYSTSIRQQPPEMAHNLHEQEIVRQSDFVQLSIGSPTPLPQTNGLPITAVTEAFAHNGNGRHKHPN